MKKQYPIVYYLVIIFLGSLLFTNCKNSKNRNESDCSIFAIENENGKMGIGVNKEGTIQMIRVGQYIVVLLLSFFIVHLAYGNDRLRSGAQRPSEHRRVRNAG